MLLCPSRARSSGSVRSALRAPFKHFVIARGLSPEHDASHAARPLRHPMSGVWYHTANEAGIPSPALLLFRERMERNLDRMVSIAGNPERLWPHVKTHKLGPVVKTQ